MGRQIFRYLRYIGKWIGMVFALGGVLIFVIQFLPKEIGSAFWIFVAGGLFWALDTLWSTLKDAGEIAEEINKHRK